MRMKKEKGKTVKDVENGHRTKRKKITGKKVRVKDEKQVMKQQINIIVCVFETEHAIQEKRIRKKKKKKKRIKKNGRCQYTF